MKSETIASEQRKDLSRPQYEKPQIRVLSEREILNEFQITQSMSGWWVTGAC